MSTRRLLVRIGLVIGTTSVLGFSALAQEAKITKKKVPTAVITAFKSAYPQATIRGYAREKENGKVYYEIESIEGQTTRDVLYNPDGTVAEIEESIAVSDLPAAAQEAMRAIYPNSVITKAEKITRGDVTEYEAHAKQGKKSVSMEFDAAGKPLKKG